MRVSDRPTCLFFEFVTPPLSFVLFSSRNLSTKSNPSSPSATSRDVTENTRRAPLRECGRGWAVNLALFILIYHQRALIPLDSPSTCGLWFVERANLQIPFGRVCTF